VKLYREPRSTTDARTSPGTANGTPVAAAGNRAVARAVTLAREGAAAPTQAPSASGEAAKLQSYLDGLSDPQAVLKVRDGLRAAPEGDFDLAIGKDKIRVYDAPSRLALLDRVGFRLMELISERFAPVRTFVVPAAPGGTAAAAASHADVEKQRGAVMQGLQPLLGEMRTFGVYNRHPDGRQNAQAAADLALAFQMLAVDVARGFLKQQEDTPDKMAGAKAVQEQAMKAGGLGPKDAWCGAFAFMSSQGVGLAGEFASLSQGTGGYMGQFTYGFDTWVYDGTWRALKAYHQERKALRGHVDLRHTKVDDYRKLTLKDAGGADIGPPQPGDVVLIDNAEGLEPDHVQMVASFDAAAGTLRTIGGNEVKSPGMVHESEEKAPKDTGPQDMTGKGEYKKNADGSFALDEKGEKIYIRKMKTGRIAFIGRWSLVDFETHVYALKKPSGT